MDAKVQALLNGLVLKVAGKVADGPAIGQHTNVYPVKGSMAEGFSAVEIVKQLIAAFPTSAFCFFAKPQPAPAAEAPDAGKGKKS